MILCVCGVVEVGISVLQIGFVDMSDAGGGEFVVCVAILYGSLIAFGRRPWMLCAEPVAFVG